MQVQEIMTRSAEIIDPGASVRDAARKMREWNLGALPVGENDRLAGDGDGPRHYGTRRRRGSIRVRGISEPTGQPRR